MRRLLVALPALVLLACSHSADTGPCGPCHSPETPGLGRVGLPRSGKLEQLAQRTCRARTKAARPAACLVRARDGDARRAFRRVPRRRLRGARLRPPRRDAPAHPHRVPRRRDRPEGPDEGARGEGVRGGGSGEPGGLARRRGGVLAGRGERGDVIHLQPKGCVSSRAALRESAARRLHMGTGTDRIEKRVLLRAPRSRVWRAITDAREFGSWFGVAFDGPSPSIQRSTTRRSRRPSSSSSSPTPRTAPCSPSANRGSTTCPSPAAPRRSR